MWLAIKPVGKIAEQCLLKGFWGMARGIVFVSIAAMKVFHVKVLRSNILLSILSYVVGLALQHNLG